jgi:hypothetical protein
MNRETATNARVIALGVMLLIAALATLVIAFGRPTPPAPPAASDLKYSYIIDVAGWYEITPNEAVASPYDFSIDSLKRLPDHRALERLAGLARR